MRISNASGRQSGRKERKGFKEKGANKTRKSIEGKESD